MNEAQELHLQSVKNRITSRIDHKYRRGAEEHGGELENKRGIIGMSLDEAADLAVYLYTLKDQIDDLHCPDCGRKIELGKIDEANVL